jgi:hypothetical protein
MAEVVKETVVTKGSTGGQVVVKPVKVEASHSQTVEYLVYFLFGFLEVLLAFRLILKLMGANVGSSFVAMIYGITSIFILPFEGIFRRFVTQGVETAAILEPATLVAIIVYAVVCWGVVMLTRILSRDKTRLE